MSKLLQDYLDRLHQAGNADQLCEALGVTAAALGAPLFAYLALPTSVGARPRLITNYPPAWREHYTACRYDTCDPVVHRFQRDPNPFEWSDALADNCPFARAFFGETACFGISYGYTVPMRYWHGRFAAVTFATDVRCAASRACLRSNCLGFEAVALQFHLQVCAKLQTRYQVAGASLTPREHECLTWVARGKSYIEISEILKISPRTVKFHIENAKSKLGVSKLHQAILLFTGSNNA